MFTAIGRWRGTKSLIAAGLVLVMIYKAELVSLFYATMPQSRALICLRRNLRKTSWMLLIDINKDGALSFCYFDSLSKIKFLRLKDKDESEALILLIYSL